MKNKKAMLYLCYIAFGFIGFILSMRTNVFHFVQRDYLDGYGHIATLILFSGICMQITLYFSGNLIEKYGYKLVLWIGLIAFAIPVMLMVFVGSALSFDLTYILLMFGYGVVVLVLNLFVSYLEPDRKGNVLLVLHLYFAIGALVGPKWISYLTDTGIPWQRVMAFSGVPLLIIAFMVLRFKGQVEKIKRQETSSQKNLQKDLKSPFVWLFIILFMCSQTWEYGIGTWFVIFASNTKQMSSSEAAFYLTLFYGSYPLIRIIFSKIIHRLNLLSVLMVAFIGCGAFIGAGIVTGNLVFYSLTGMGVALMYPGMMAAMQHIFGEESTKTIGFITMIGGLIQYVAIWGVGLISDQWGIYYGFTSMIIYMVIGSVSLAGIIYLVKKDEKAREVKIYRYNA